MTLLENKNRLNMRRYISPILLLSMAILAGCEQNESRYPEVYFGDYSVINTVQTSSNQKANVAVGDVVGYMNLSQGNSNAFWELDSGAYFVSQDYNDDSSENYKNYIVSDHLSYDSKVFILFDTPTTGYEFGVRLYNEFDEYVSYEPQLKYDNHYVFYESTYNRFIDKWVTDDTFYWYVVDNVGLDITVKNSDGDTLYMFERSALESGMDWSEITLSKSSDVMTLDLDFEFYGAATSITLSKVGGAEYDSSYILSDQKLELDYTETAVGEYVAGTIKLSRSEDDVDGVRSSTISIEIPLRVIITE